MRRDLEARVRAAPVVADLAVPLAALLALVFVLGISRFAWDLHDFPDPLLLDRAVAALHAASRELLTAVALGPVLVVLPLLAWPRRRRLLAFAGAVGLVVAAGGWVAPWAMSLLPAEVPSSRPPSDVDFWYGQEIVQAALTGQAPATGEPLAGARIMFLTREARQWTRALLGLAAAALCLGCRRRLTVPWWATCGAAGAGFVLAMALRLAWPLPDERTGPWMSPGLLVLAFVPHALLGAGALAAARRWGSEELAPAPPASLRRKVAAVTLVGGAGAMFVGAWVALMLIVAPLDMRNWVPGRGPRPGREAPDFALTDLRGEAVRLSSLRGRPVLVVFWATWCGPCQSEWPHLERLQREHAGRLVVLAVSKDEDRAALDAFAAAHRDAPRILVADPGALDDYGVLGIPATYLIDAGGFVAWRTQGFGRTMPLQLERALRRLTP